MYTVEQKRNFQDLLRNQRKSRGWTQDVAGEISGLGQRVVSELERGPAQGVPFLTIARMAYTYGFSLDYIAKTLGIVGENVKTAEEGGRSVDGLSTDFFNLPAEEQARIIRVINYCIYDYFNVTGGSYTHTAPDFEHVSATALREE